MNQEFENSLSQAIRSAAALGFPCRLAAVRSIAAAIRYRSLGGGGGGCGCRYQLRTMSRDVSTATDG
jgi:hypothetical protein